MAQKPPKTPDAERREHHDHHHGGHEDVIRALEAEIVRLVQENEHMNTALEHLKTAVAALLAAIKANIDPANITQVEAIAVQLQDAANALMGSVGGATSLGTLSSSSGTSPNFVLSFPDTSKFQTGQTLVSKVSATGALDPGQAVVQPGITPTTVTVIGTSDFSPTPGHVFGIQGTLVAGQPGNSGQGIDSATGQPFNPGQTTGQNPGQTFPGNPGQQNPGGPSFPNQGQPFNPSSPFGTPNPGR